MKAQKSTRATRQAQGQSFARSSNSRIMNKQDRFGKYIPKERYKPATNA